MLFETRRCVKVRLRPGPAGGAYSCPPDCLAGFGDGNKEGGMERARDRKEPKEKERKGREMKNGKWKLGEGSLRHWEIDAPAQR